MSARKKISTHDLGIRMWYLAESDARYRKALGAARVDVRDREKWGETCRNFWVFGAIYALNVLIGEEFGKKGPGLKIYQIVETGEIVVSGPKLFLKLPNIDLEGNGE